MLFFFFFSSRRRHTRCGRDWSSDVCSSDLPERIERLREEMKRALPPMSAETVPGLIPNIIVGRIANRLDLMGPTYTVDAACASSLVAVQLAMRDLLEDRKSTR